MKLLDGKTVEQIKIEITDEISEIKKFNKVPHLAAVLVGSNGASITYVNAKVKACEKVGMQSSLVKLDENISEENLLQEIDTEQNEHIDGFIVQLPLPKHIDEDKILLAVHPEKDVDDFIRKCR